MTKIKVECPCCGAEDEYDAADYTSKHRAVYAAAPEMLEACKQTVELLSGHLGFGENDPRYSECRALKALRAVIARAEGRNP